MRAPSRLALALPAAAAVALVPWTVAIFTGLPHSAMARHWNTAWAGLDVAIAAGLALTSWLGWRRDRRATPVASATVTLMCADVWFDVCTSGSGYPLAVALACAVAELAVAAGCLLVGLRYAPTR